MTDVIEVGAWIAAALFAVAGLWGAVRWWLVAPSAWFWRVLRGSQAVYLAWLVLVVVWLLGGSRPDDDLFYVYALVPVLVSFLGEQLRIASAQSVLDARGLEDARAVGRLEAAGQQSVVTAILRREMGVMALAALFCAGLLLRVVL
jgi:hypothetical protein